MDKFPKNQIKYILKSKWDESRDLEKAILSYFYGNKKEVSLKKTDDLILLYILRISNKDKTLLSKLRMLIFLSTYFFLRNK